MLYHYCNSSDENKQKEEEERETDKKADKGNEKKDRDT